MAKKNSRLSVPEFLPALDARLATLPDLEVLKKPISHIPMLQQTYDRLQKIGIVRLGQLVVSTAEELRQFIGGRGKNDIEETLADEYKLRLGMTAADFDEGAAEE